MAESLQLPLLQQELVEILKNEDHYLVFANALMSPLVEYMRIAFPGKEIASSLISELHQHLSNELSSALCISFPVYTGNIPISSAVMPLINKSSGDAKFHYPCHIPLTSYLLIQCKRPCEIYVTCSACDYTPTHSYSAFIALTRIEINEPFTTFTPARIHKFDDAFAISPLMQQAQQPIVVNTRVTTKNVCIAVNLFSNMSARFAAKICVSDANQAAGISVRVVETRIGT